MIPEATTGAAFDFEVFWRRRWWLIGSTILVTTAFGIAAFVMTPIYQASVVLAPVNLGREYGSLSSALGQLGGVASLVGVNVGNSDGETQLSLAVLRSRQFTDQFIVDNDLMPKLFAKSWDSKKSAWRTSIRHPPTIWRAYDYFNREVRSVTEDRKTGLVTLNIDWTSPAEAAVWANDLVDRLNAEMRNRAIANSTRRISYLQKELGRTEQVDTREAINRLIESEIKHRMVADTTKEYSFRVIDPAIAPDRDHPLKPKKLIMLAEGFLIGLFLSLGLVPLYERMRKDA